MKYLRTVSRVDKYYNIIVELTSQYQLERVLSLQDLGILYGGPNELYYFIENVEFSLRSSFLRLVWAGV